MLSLNSEKIGDKARKIIDEYLALPVGAKPNCPYFNNKRRKIRGSLRVVKGKGSPEEIAEECEIDAKLSRVKVSELSTDELKAFLIEKDLGIDCSGFAYHVLNAFSQEKSRKSIQSHVRHLRRGLIGSLLGRLRPAENIGVSAFANEKNSRPVRISEAKPGDIVVFLGTGKGQNYNHILVITGIERTNGETRVSYAHSYAWPSDGAFGHGVREGDILVHGEDLLNATWKEKGVTGIDNYTFESARNAKEVSVRRINM